MYLEHFGLCEFPFSLSPDRQFWVALPSYGEALDAVYVALANGEGFVRVVGEVGTGKTMLCRQLLAELDGGFATAYIPNPELSTGEFLWTLARELGLEVPRGERVAELRTRIVDRALERWREELPVVLVIDEAQAMPDGTLEALRLLTNVEAEFGRLIQVALFGQPELEEKLRQPHMRQLRQRFTLRIGLDAMEWSDVQTYLENRLLAAGCWRPDLFDARAVALIQRASRGIPRVINVLAHKAMVCAFGEFSQRITRRHVRRAVADTEDAYGGPLRRLGRRIGGRWGART